MISVAVATKFNSLFFFFKILFIHLRERKRERALINQKRGAPVIVQARGDGGRDPGEDGVGEECEQIPDLTRNLPLSLVSGSLLQAEHGLGILTSFCKIFLQISSPVW